MTASDLGWADLVLAMESKHVAHLRAQFAHETEIPPMRSMDIPDDFEFMSPELIDLLQPAIEDAIADLAGG